MPRRINPDFLTAETRARVNLPLPHVEIGMITYYDAQNVERTVSEEHSLMLLRDSVDNAWLHEPIKYKNGFYRRATLKTLNLNICMQCFSVGNLINDECVVCRRVVEQIYAKQAPRDGWQKFGTGPYVGFEIELEFPSEDCRVSGSMGRFAEIAREKEWYLPLAYTGDSSLENGVELNTHMLGLDWIKANQNLIDHTVERLVTSRARSTDRDDVQRAAIHIHYDIGECDDTNHFQTWLKTKYEFCLSISDRTPSKFDHWCWKGAYSYFAKRNKSTTWECRGFSSDALLEHPEAFIHMVAWVHTMGFVSKNPRYMFKSIYNCFVAAGFPESAAYWEGRDARGMHEVKEITRQLTINEKQDLKAQAIRIPDFDNWVWLETFYDNRTIGGFSNGGRITVDIADIIEWDRMVPPQLTVTEEMYPCV